MSYQLLRPDPRLRSKIENAAQAASNMCWTCGSCDFECPVNRATGSLRPQKVVRLATMGLLDELAALPEVWYCQTCRRCIEVCPNRVKPATLIEYARQQALGRGRVSMEKYRQFKALFSLFQRVRWHATAYAMQNDLPDLSHSQWCDWLEEPIPEMAFTVTKQHYLPHAVTPGNRQDDFHPQACFTCGECSSACPVSGERHVFDPRTIFRMVNLGLAERLLNAPSIWLCIACQRCSDACSQLVEGHQVIKQLQSQAIESGAVDRDFPHRLEKTNRLIYTRLLDEIDMLFNFNSRNRTRIQHHAEIIDALNSQELCAARPVRPA